MMNQQRLRIAVVAMACGAIVAYALHVLLGTLAYPGYDSMAQAVSDLTSDDAPSRHVARLFSSLYGLFSSLVAIGLIVLFRRDRRRMLRAGVTLLSVMYVVSAIGYALFPLPDATRMSSVQGIMHLVVTAVVVLLTIVAMIVLLIAFWRLRKMVGFALTLVTFLMLLLGAGLMNVVDRAYFGLAERFSVYSVVWYLGVVSVMTLRLEHDADDTVIE